MSGCREDNSWVGDGWEIKYRRLIINILYKSGLNNIKWKPHADTKVVLIMEWP